MSMSSHSGTLALKNKPEIVGNVELNFMTSIVEKRRADFGTTNKAAYGMRANVSIENVPP